MQRHEVRDRYAKHEHEEDRLDHARDRRATDFSCECRERGLAAAGVESPQRVRVEEDDLVRCSGPTSSAVSTVVSETGAALCTSAGDPVLSSTA